MKRILFIITVLAGLLLACSPEKLPDGKKIDPITKPDPIETPSITASETSLNFSADGGSQTITITANFTWEIVSKPSWITISPSSGSNGSTIVTITSDKSTSTSTLTGTITIGKSTSATISIAVSQLEASPDFTSEIVTVNGVSFKIIRVDGGKFWMGNTNEVVLWEDDDELPYHSVSLSTYYIGETEVTQELWEAVMGSNPSEFKSARKPVECVSWNDCQTFITRLNSMTGRTFRLPTEAEWEYAAHGGKNSEDYKYSGSNNVDNVAWYDENSNSETHTVATKQANELGLYDMSGNVWEWCQDWYGSYSSESQTDPTGPSTGSYRVRRGGGWGDSAWRCHVSGRSYSLPGYWSPNIGLRLAMDFHIFIILD